jgi:aminoglycoside phosphotransferase (APT) family kinase protein
VHDLDFDTTAFGRWLAGQTGQEAVLAFEPIPGGASCELFRMTRLGVRWIIRRAPKVAVASSAHNVLREARIIRALHGSALPVPAVLACSDDCGLLGAPFFIMEYIDGEVLRRELPRSYLDHPATQRAVGEELVDRLADLHAFDWKHSAIAELARPEGFLARQVERWMSQLSQYRTRELPGIDEVAQWLEDHLPPGGDLVVMHGDYKLDNVIFSRSAPPRILGLLDFEMTTVGDPLIDLAWAMIFWPGEGNLIAFPGVGVPGGFDAAFCQAPQQLVQRYAQRTGRDMGHLQWYQAFSAWKLAIVLEGSYVKHLEGVSKNPSHRYLGFTIEQLLARARRFAV